VKAGERHSDTGEQTEAGLRGSGFECAGVAARERLVRALAASPDTPHE